MQAQVTLPPRRSPPVLARAVALAALVALLGVLARPSPPSLSTWATGDPALAAVARPLLRGALDRVSIAAIDGDTVSYLAAFALASMLIDWTVAPAALWLAAVGLLAGGVAGAALRWPGLAWYAGTRPRWRAGGVIATLCVCTLIIGAALN